MNGVEVKLLVIDRTHRCILLQVKGCDGLNKLQSFGIYFTRLGSSASWQS